MYDIGLFTYKTMTSKLKTDVLLYLGWLLYRLLGNRFFFSSRQPAAHGHIQRGIGHCYHRTIGLEVFLQQHHRGLRFKKIRELAPKWGYQKKKTQLWLIFFVLNYPDYKFVCKTGVKSFWALPKWEGLEDWPFRLWTPGRHPTVCCQADQRKPPNRGMYGCRAFNMFIK